MDLLQRKRKLVNNISILDYNEKRHIFHILKKNNVSFTKNQNGYFFNFTNIEEKILDVLEKCVDVIITHRQELQILDEKRDLQIREFKEMISKTMKEKIRKRNEEEIHRLKLVNLDSDIHKIITQRIRIKMKFIDPNNIDNEMKLINKIPKYPKNTVYWRLSQKINTRTRNNVSKAEVQEYDEKPIQVDDDMDDMIDYNDDLLDDKVSDDFDIDEDSGMNELDDNEIEDNEIDEEDVDDEIIIDDEVDLDEIENDEMNLLDDNENGETTRKNTKRKSTKTKNDEFNEKYLHFKHLLKTKGFTCLENNSRLKEETYIELDEITGEIKEQVY